MPHPDAWTARVAGATDLDAIRAGGYLVEYRSDEGGFFSGSAYVTDKELDADVLWRRVEADETEAQKPIEEDAAWKTRSGKIGQHAEEQQEPREVEREKAKRTRPCWPGPLEDRWIEVEMRQVGGDLEGADPSWHLREGHWNQDL